MNVRRVKGVAGALEELSAIRAGARGTRRPWRSNMPRIKGRAPSLLAVDCESTGLDVYHGARPYFVSAYDGSGTPSFWSWPVDPETRRVTIPEEDAEEIRQLVAGAERVVGQNLKFDSAMLKEAGILADWPWGKTEDTIMAGHLLKSNQPHNLTTMTLVYLGKDIEPLEKAMEKAVKKARNAVQQARLRQKRRGQDEPLAGWRIASEDLPEMPSAKGDLWKNDMWLLQHYEGGEHYHLVEEYACMDVWATWHLWRVFEDKIRKERLWEIYRERVRVLPVAADMERRGVTLSRKRLEEQSVRYARESAKAAKMCVAIAKTYDYDLQLPKSGNNGSLGKFCFGEEGIRLPVVAKSKKTGAPSFDKAVIDYYLSNLDEEGKQHRFVKALSDKRKRDTAVQYMESYKRFWLHVRGDFYVLHPSLNATGTDTLRWSSSNPNEQNISKKEGFNLRYSFGPAPGREWRSLDYENIERRIPAYEAGEELIIKLFESPDEPPFYGSEHLLNASIIFSDLFWPLFERNKRLPPQEFVALCKKQPWYRPTKNTGFAIQYGCQEAKADATAGRSGAYKTLRKATPKIFRLNDRYVEMANRLGYVETLPDKDIGAKRGYPVWCSRSTWGGVSPTVPFNYHIQSTAMWCTAKAMPRCKEQLDEWSREEGEDFFIAMQVHDEIVFDFPAGGKKNQDKVKRLQELMEMSGEDIGIPLKVSASYHPNNWSEEGEL